MPVLPRFVSHRNVKPFMIKISKHQFDVFKRQKHDTP